MGAYELLKRQRNDVFGVLVEHRLDPNDFKWSELDSERSNGHTVSALFHKSNKYFMVFDYVESFRILDYSPGTELTFENNLAHSWKEALKVVGRWCSSLHHELTTPDLWAEANKSSLQGFAQLTTGAPISNFEPEEQAQVEKGLEEIRGYLFKVIELQAKDREYVEGQFKYLAEASARLPKRDWLGMFIGIFLSILANAAVPGDKVADLLRQAYTTLQACVRGLLEGG